MTMIKRTSDSDVILTAGQVAEWEQRKSDLEGQITASQSELADIHRKLDAVAVLRGENESKPTRLVEISTIGKTDESMIEAIERIVNAVPEPMKKLRLKRRLIADGFDESRLGNYFYTTIKRLKDRNRIVVLDDGRVTAPRGARSSEHGNAGQPVEEKPGASV